MQKPQERIQRKSVIEVSVNILIAFEDTIRLSADILIVFVNILIVFPVSQEENKTPRQEGTNCPILVMLQNGVRFDRWKRN